MSDPTSIKPDREIDASVYSNFDHVLDEGVAAALADDPTVCAQHGAWNFCGYVWRDSDGLWRNEVWQWNAPVAVIAGDSVQEVIDAANEEYGND